MTDGRPDGWAAVYDELAPSYDEMTGDQGWWANEQAARVLAPLALGPRRALDLGAGTGQTSQMLQRLYPGVELTLVDPSSEMIALASEKLPRAEVAVEDAADFLRTSGARWDLIVAIGLLELVPDQFELLSLAASRLVPGGHLVVTHEPRLTGDSLQSRPTSVVAGGLLVQRHSSEDVEQHAASHGLARIVSHDFVAFQRGGGGGIDAVYELVVWRAARSD